jgi:hypothetical protein
VLEIQKAIKKIIERFIAQMVPLQADAHAGDTFVDIESTRRFLQGDSIVVRKEDSTDAEVHTVLLIEDRHRLILADALTADWPVSTGYVQKLTGFASGNTEFLKAVYIGDPAVIQQFPAITIDAKSRASEWITLESTSETYEIDITVYVDGLAHFESQYELMMAYTKAIETSLFRSFYPLVRPYYTAKLLNGVSTGDTTISVDDEQIWFCGVGWIFLESPDYTEPNRLLENLGGGVFRLERAITKEFSVGDNIIHPFVHVYNTLAHTTQYGTVNKGTTLKAAVISFRAQIESRRYTPFFDSLTF